MKSTGTLRAHRVRLVNRIKVEGCTPDLVRALGEVGAELCRRSGTHRRTWSEVVGIPVGGGPAERCGRGVSWPT